MSQPEPAPQPEPEAQPEQNSVSANVAELAAQMNAVLEIGSSVDRVIREKGAADWRVWSQLEHKSTDYMSANYGVKQKTNLTQLGIEKALDNQFIVGGILS